MADPTLTITLPARGLSLRNPEVKFALIFAGVLAALTAFFASMIRWAPASFSIPVVGLLGLFWVAVFVMAFEAWRRSRQIAILDVLDDTLLINTRMPFSKRSIAIESRFIKALGVGPSGVVVDDVPILALRIDVTKPVEVKPGTRKKKLVLFRERDEAELERIASQLRLALGIDTKDDADWAEDGAGSSGHTGMSPGNI